MLKTAEMQLLLCFQWSGNCLLIYEVGILQPRINLSHAIRCRQRCLMATCDTVNKLAINVIESKHVMFLWPCTNRQNSASCCHTSAVSIQRALIQYKGRVMTVIFNSICRKWCFFRIKLVINIDHFAEQCCSDHSVIPGEATETSIKGLRIFEAQSNNLILSSEMFTERIVTAPLTSPFYSWLLRSAAPSTS